MAEAARGTVIRSLTALSIVLSLAHAPLSAQESEWDDEWGDDWVEDSEAGWTVNGFVELGAGARLGDDPVLDEDLTLGELRLRLETQRDFDRVRLTFKGDAYYDEVTGGLEGDLRELAVGFSPAASLDVKLGRQVLTWGTGDFVFLNDLFPKDFQSFFAGREDEYLKAASDSLRLSWFGTAFNVDLAWTPEFEPDIYLTGERFSFFSPMMGGTVAPATGRIPGPDRFPADGELAARIYRTIGGTEWAAYGYRGFFKSPLGLREDGTPFYPELNVWGGSMRRPLGPGLLNAEAAWYDSREDASGGNPAIPNDQLRLLIGYEQELVTRLTLGLQAYLERTLDYRALVAHSPAPEFEPDRNRGVVTARLTYRARQDKLTVSLFTFASPTDDDYHLRPSVDYRRNDQWTFTAGANLFGGDHPNTFFNQLDGNDNAYVRVRYSF